MKKQTRLEKIEQRKEQLYAEIKAHYASIDILFAKLRAIDQEVNNVRVNNKRANAA